jgi:pimeloyl-ACP methyl ester carboxylesterase
MAKVTASVLVIHGERDIQPEKTTRDYAAAFPRARVDVIRDAGHFPFIDQPETFAAITGAFLKEIQ